MSKWKDSAFAKVWPMSAWGKKDGRNWNALKYEEKEFFKHLCVEKYIDKKIPELNLPKLRISEMNIPKPGESFICMHQMQSSGVKFLILI